MLLQSGTGAGGTGCPAVTVTTLTIRFWMQPRAVAIKLIVAPAGSAALHPAFRLAELFTRSCRIAGVASSHTYAPDCMQLMVATIVNSALSFVSGRAERFGSGRLQCQGHAQGRADCPVGHTLRDCKLYGIRNDFVST